MRSQANTGDHEMLGLHVSIVLVDFLISMIIKPHSTFKFYFPKESEGHLWVTVNHVNYYPALAVAAPGCPSVKTSY